MILPVRPHFIFDLLPKDQRQDFIIPVPCRESGSPTMLEWALLIACGRLAKAGFREPSGIFEIGTYKGVTALLMLRNFPGAVISTLDLDTSLSDDLLAAPLLKVTVNRCCGHSIVFPFGPYLNKQTLIFIDGAHDYNTVSYDSGHAVSMLTPEGPAAIIWHDYSPAWPGVQQYCREFAELEYTRQNGKVYHIEDTSLCVYLRGIQ